MNEQGRRIPCRLHPAERTTAAALARYRSEPTGI